MQISCFLEAQHKPGTGFACAPQVGLVIPKYESWFGPQDVCPKKLQLLGDLVLRPFEGEGEGRPGIHCMRMRYVFRKSVRTLIPTTC